MNILDEELIGIEEVSQYVPKKNGKRLHLATAYRWVNRGINGIRLESVLCGRRMCTSREAIRRFFVALNANRNPAPAPRTLAQRAKASARAADELQKMGV